MKNKLSDVKNHLIEAMERLNDDELVEDKEKLEKEIQKAQALSTIAEQIVAINQVEINEKNANVNAMKIAYDLGFTYKPEGMLLEDNVKGIKHII